MITVIGRYRCAGSGIIIHIFYDSKQEMQGAAQVLKNDIWERLKVVFDRYKNQNNELNIDNLDEFIVDILKEQTQSERDYVLKNHFRLDVDNSGQVSLTELGNFLFKRHCCEMSLQRSHRAGKITHGAERKLTLEEFLTLINEAYAFLHVAISHEVGEYIFNQVDKDHDHLITYVQYFQAIEKFVCKDPRDDGRDKKDGAAEGIERHSKLRKYMWDNLRALYEAYVQGRTLEANDAELKALLFAIVGELSDNDVTFIASGLHGFSNKSIQFDAFASRFIYLIGELGLSKFAINRQSSKRTLTKEQFAKLLKNSYSFLKLDNFKDSILFKIFDKIDKDHDGLISYEEYLDWVRRFLSVLVYRGDEFYVPQDDEDTDSSDPFEKPQPPLHTNPVNRFTFDDYTFAKQVRARVLELIIPYDDNKNKQFSQQEISNSLEGIMKENKNEVVYVIKNVFRYDRNNDGYVTYFELTNFYVEQHFGEIIIQRLHRKGFYSKGSERIMNRDEFGRTINLVLDFIQMKATEELLDSWFKVIDLDHDGWISYQVYFLFLKYYFGGASLAALDNIKETTDNKGAPLSEDQAFLNSLSDLNPFERFSRIIIDQLKNIFFKYDHNKNQVFEIDEIRDILQKVFELDENEVSYILMKYFTFDAESGGALTFDELISLILTIYFTEILFRRKFNSNNSKGWGQHKISLEDFIKIFTEDTFFIRIKPSREDLTYIFNELDADKDGFITFQQYVDFVRKYLGNGIDLSSSKYSAELGGVSEEELKFVQAIWDELKIYFDRYDKGAKGHLAEAELKAFVVEVLQETTERQLNYVFWNLFRVDVDSNKEVEFLQFAPFILNHAGEISLQRFHRQQVAGKGTLSSHEFYQVLSNAYSFLSSIPKEKKIIRSIFDRIKTANTDGASYAAFLNWIHRALAAKYKK